jgi:DNA-binding response OmpR family regulator
MIVYQTRNHRLVLEDGKEVELTNGEHKFLTVLSNGSLVTHDEFSKLFWGYIPKRSIKSKHQRYISLLKFKFAQKTGLEIRNMFNVGYVLQTDVYYI